MTTGQRRTRKTTTGAARRTSVERRLANIERALDGIGWQLAHGAGLLVTAPESAAAIARGNLVRLAAETEPDEEAPSPSKTAAGLARRLDELYGDAWTPPEWEEPAT